MDSQRLDHEHRLRVLLFTEQRLIGEMVKLTLSHGAYVTRHAHRVDDALAMVAEWQPQLAIIDLDAGGDWLVRQIG